MKRRAFIAGLGSAAAWPVVARAQQAAMPVIGYLGAQFAYGSTDFTVPFLQGLKETGYVEGQNVAVEYRHAENQYDRLPALAADLVRRRVAVLVAPGSPAALAAKAATTTIPIIFSTGADQNRTNMLLGKSCEGHFEIAVGSDTRNNELQAQRARRRLQSCDLGWGRRSPRVHENAEPGSIG